MELKEPIRKSFERMKRVATNDMLVMSSTELRDKGVINSTNPLAHLKKLKEAGWIDYESNKVGNKNPLIIRFL